ncbi:MAG: HipA N-terminal domain-containing protein [Chitinispirillaceae bacterium]
MTALRSGKVFYRESFAGTIKETEEGYSFSYDPSYLSSPNAHPISVTLPLRAEPYESSTLHAFFDGLIPEGWLLSVVMKNWKVNPRDRMGLLLTVCRDCIGAVGIEENT